MVICLEWGAGLYMAQLMPLPHTVSCFTKIEIGFTFLVVAHPGSPGKKRPLNVCMCVCVVAHPVVLENIHRICVLIYNCSISGILYSVLCVGDKYLKISGWWSDHTRRSEESGIWSDNGQQCCCCTGANTGPVSGAKYGGLRRWSQWWSCCIVWWFKLLGQQSLAKR